MTSEHPHHELYQQHGIDPLTTDQQARQNALYQEHATVVRQIMEDLASGNPSAPGTRERLDAIRAEMDALDAPLIALMQEQWKTQYGIDLSKAPDGPVTPSE